MTKIAVFGAGTWGIALARLLAANGRDVTVWSAIPAELKSLSTTHRHPNLPGMELPAAMHYTADIAEACTGRDILLFAVPSPFVRATAKKAAPHIPEGQLIVDVAKGVEDKTLMTMSEIIEDELAKAGRKARVVALSGPTHAEEVARDMPTAIVAASADEDAAKTVQKVFTTPAFRVYTNDDRRGTELGGAVKNVIALAVGIALGLGYGDNAKAALITRGNAELSRLGIAMGCKPETFAGLSGMGDLIVTCTSMHSRNLHAGMLIGRGKSVEDAKTEVGQVVEGINALPAAMQLMERYQVEMPIAKAVNAVVKGEISAKDMALALMTRDKTSEVRQSELAVRFESALMRHISGGIMRRVMVIGEFADLSHEAIAFLTRAKDEGGHLTVALTGCAQDVRKSSLLALRCVDRVLDLETEKLTLPELMRLYRIEVLVLAEGQDVPEMLPPTVKVKYL